MRFLFAISVIMCLGIGLGISCGGDDDEPDGDGESTGGTWTDSTTGLVWQEPPADGKFNWDDAVNRCESLVLGGRSDWRLPDIDELRSLIQGCAATQTGGACDVANECLEKDCRNGPCEGCAELQGPGTGGCHRDPALTGPYMWYWSSSTLANDEDRAWGVGFGGAHVSHHPKATEIMNVRCVRSP